MVMVNLSFNLLGEMGHKCSADTKAFITHYYSNPNLYSDEKSLTTEQLVYNKLAENNFEKISLSYQMAEKHLACQKYDSYFSGCTASLLIILGIYFYITI